MATGNLFLGTARRKVGDVVLYRRNGVQQSRVRVRTIANPKTLGQALQRNYVAPVNKFYAPLAAVLERSWEGLDKSRSHNAFMKANIDLARNNGYYVEKGAGFTALPYQVSQGTLPPLDVDFPAGSDLVLNVPGLLSTDTTLAAFSAKLIAAYGLQEGDQITIIATISYGSTYANQRPVYGRFFLSLSDITPLTDAIPGFSVTIGSSEVVFMGSGGTSFDAGTLIVSRWDGSKWLRSTQQIVCEPEYLERFTSENARAAAIASYQGGASVVESDIYLNGSTGTEGTAEGGVVVYVRSGSLSEPVQVTSLAIAGIGSTGSTQVLLVNGKTLASGATRSFIVVAGFGEIEDKYLESKTAWSGVTYETGDTAGLRYTTLDGQETPFTRWLTANGVTATLTE